MAECTFRHGNPINIDHTPTGGNVAAGQVVVGGSVTGNTAGYGLFSGIAPVPIVNNVKGALSVGGVWEVTNLNNAADRALVYWDDSANKVTTVSTNNALFGVIVGRGGAGANTACDVLHVPAPSSFALS
jgi:hypothetical protein